MSSNEIRKAAEILDKRRQELDEFRTLVCRAIFHPKMTTQPVRQIVVAAGHLVRLSVVAAQVEFALDAYRRIYDEVMGR